MRKPGSTTRWGLVLLVAGLAGCEQATSPDPDPDPEYLGSVVTQGPANVLSASVEVSATGYDQVALRMRTPGEPEMISPPYAFSGGTARPSALGLLPDRTYEVDVVLDPGPGEAIGETLTLVTGSLPGWLPSITPVGTPAADGFIALAHPGGPVIVDNLGRVRWYFEEPDATLNNFTVHPDGSYTLFGLDDADRVYRVLDELGEVVGQLACVGRPTRFHEVRVLSNGDRWMMCDDAVPTDLSSRGGDANGVVVWTVVQRVSAAGALVFEFNTADHFSLDDIDPDVIVGASTVNITHGNGLAFDGDGNVLLSWRSLNEITKVDAATGDVIWRLGGRANQFMIDDDTREFERQHGLRAAGPGLIQFLDNGTAAPSRAVRYEIDEGTRTATRIVEYIDASMAFSLVGGSTEPVGTGAMLVSFGRAGKVVEVDPAGGLMFDLSGLDGQYIFRASRIPSLYASERRED